jgi:hypothetical protein
MTAVSRAGSRVAQSVKPAVLDAKSSQAAITAAVQQFVRKGYLKAWDGTGSGQIFVQAPDKRTIANPTKPVQVGAFDTFPELARQPVQPTFAEPATPQKFNVHFDGGTAFFSKGGKSMWFNSNGSVKAPSFAKAMSGLWYGPIPTGK